VDAPLLDGVPQLVLASGRHGKYDSYVTPHSLLAFGFIISIQVKVQTKKNNRELIKCHNTFIILDFATEKTNSTHK
jgi:hypothetical protein